MKLIRGRRLKWLLWSVALIVLLLLATVYYHHDPAVTRWMPRCMIHELTGFECPGCGAQRMAYALLHGDFAAAWGANPFLLCSLPLIAVGIYADCRPGRVRKAFYHPLFIQSYTILIILWGIGRNFL